MKRLHRLLLTAVVGVALAGIQGCASVSVERGKDVSSAAIKYADATTAVVELAIDASIDTDSLVLTQDASVPRDPARLVALNGGLIKSTSTYMAFKGSLSMVKAFFVALQDLANGSQADATEAAVKSLGEQVNGLNKALADSDGRAALSADKINALGGLGKIVAAQVHGAKVAKALQENATHIGTALAMHEKLLQVAEDDVRGGLNAVNNVFYRDRVQKPYATAAISSGWAADRKTYIKTAAISQTPAALASARSAAGQMQVVWARILSGEYSAKEMLLMLKETQDLLDAANALKEANKAAK